MAKLIVKSDVGATIAVVNGAKAAIDAAENFCQNGVDGTVASVRRSLSMMDWTFVSDKTFGVKVWIEKA